MAICRVLRDVLVEDERHQGHRWRALPVEDALALVAEDVDAAGVRILQRGEQWVPPAVGEVLASSTTMESKRWPGGRFIASSSIKAGNSCSKNCDVAALRSDSGGPCGAPHLMPRVWNSPT